MLQLFCYKSSKIFDIPVEALDQFPWNGHSVVMDKLTMEGQSIDTVLSFFGRRLQAARANYRQYIADGLAMGQRPEFVGGGRR